MVGAEPAAGGRAESAPQAQLGGMAAERVEQVRQAESELLDTLAAHPGATVAKLAEISSEQPKDGRRALPASRSAGAAREGRRRGGSEWSLARAKRAT